MNVILIGDSGHARVIADNVVSAGNKVIARLDDKYKELFKEGDIWLGPVSEVYDLIEQENAKVIIAIGSNPIRKKIVDRLDLQVCHYATVVHKEAIISPSVSIGHGSVVMPGVIVNAAAAIGKHVILNTRLVIEHDCLVDDYAHVSPGAMITGGVSIHEGVHVGAGATVIPTKSIGQWSVIGAGSVVIDDIEEYSTAVGVPAKVIKKESKTTNAANR